MIITEEELKLFIDELNEDPEKPYIMHNRDLAQAYWKELQGSYRNASFYTTDTAQYFCLGDPARAALLEIFKERQKRQEEALQATISFIEDLKKGGRSGNNSNN